MTTLLPPTARPAPGAAPADTPTPVTTLFQGYDTFTGSACATAVTGASAPTGASQRCDYTVCTSYHSLMQALSISTAVTDDFLEGSVGAKAGFVNRLNLTTYSVTVLVYANAISGDFAYTDVQPPATMPTDLRQFTQTYGDSFVSALTLGAEYLAAFVFYAQSEDEQTDVTATLNAKGISDSGSLSATVASGLQEATQSITTRQSSSQIVNGLTGLTLPSTIPEMIAFALSFGTVWNGKVTAPAVISYGTTGYEHVDGFLSRFQQVVQNRDLFVGANGQPGLSDDLSALATLKNQIAWIQQVYQTYGYTGDPDMITTGAGGKAFQVVDDYDQLATAIGLIAQDPTVEAQIPPLPSLTYGSPVLSFVLGPGTTPPWGGDEGKETGGDPYCDVTGASIIAQTTITSLQIRGGYY